MLERLSWLAIRSAARSFLSKNWEVILIVALIAGGLWWVDHRGYERAKEQDRTAELERQQVTQAIVRAIDGQLDQKLAAISSAASGKIQSIDTEGRTVVQPIITRELVRDPRLAAPGSCLSPGLLSAVNAARGYLLDDRLAGAAPGSPGAPGVPGSGKSH